VQLAQLPHAAQSAAPLVEQLNKTAWAGEMEGWLSGPARWHLVAGPEIAAEREPALNQRSGEPVAVIAPPTKSALAELAARRAAQGESHANLLPAEYAVRYRQQFVDRLWMTGLGAVIGAYILGVLVYFGVLFTMSWKKDHVVNQVKALSGSYTNAIRLKEKIDVLQNQLDLKYAALDAFKAASEKLPEDFTLNHLTFSGDQKKLTLYGIAPVDQVGVLNDYAKELRDVTINGQPVFARVTAPKYVNRGGGNNLKFDWDVVCDLNREEGQ